MLLGWIERYPIVSIEDPFAEHDAEAMASFTRTAGERIQIVGDDFFVTECEKRLEGKAKGACNAVLLKPNQVGTLTETLACWRAAQEAGYGAIVSARSGETEDVSIVHLAVGWGVPQLKVGSFARSERMAKWNEGLRIEEALGAASCPTRQGSCSSGQGMNACFGPNGRRRRMGVSRSVQWRLVERHAQGGDSRSR